MRKKSKKPFYAREVISKIIPTDYRYHALRLLSKKDLTKKELSKGLAKISAAESTRKVGYVSPDNLKKDLGSLEKSGMIRRTKEGVEVTDFGKKILNVTTNYFFGGKAPNKIETASSRERGKQVVRYGPLTYTFFGTAGTGFTKFMEMVDLHKLTKKDWLIYGGNKELGSKEKGRLLYYKETGMIPIKPFSITLLARQKLIETEKPVIWKKIDKGMHRATFFKSGGDIYVHEILPTAMKIIDIVGKLSEREINEIPHFQKRKSATEVEYKKQKKAFFKKKGIDQKLVENLSGPEIKVLYWLGKGVDNYREIHRKTNLGKSSTVRAFSSLESKGLISRHPMKLRVTLEKPKTKRIVNYLEALESAVLEESKKNPKFRKKMFGV